MNILGQTNPVQVPVGNETVISQPGTPTTAPVAKPQWFSLIENPMFLLVLMIVVMYFFIFRSKRTQDNKRKDMLGNLKRGDKVQTIGGIMGTVVEARDTDVLVKVDESSNTKIRFSRNAIHRVIEEEKTDNK